MPLRWKDSATPTGGGFLDTLKQKLHDQFGTQEDLSPEPTSTVQPVSDSEPDTYWGGFLKGLRGIPAALTRTGSGLVGSAIAAEPGIGTAIGGAIGGAGESAAEWLEGSEQNPARIATEAGLTAIPLSKVFMAGRPLASAMRGAALQGVGTVGRQVAEGQMPHIGLGEGVGIAASGGLGALLGLGGRGMGAVEEAATKPRGPFVVEPTSQGSSGLPGMVSRAPRPIATSPGEVAATQVESVRTPQQRAVAGEVQKVRNDLSAVPYNLQGDASKLRWADMGPTPEPTLTQPFEPVDRQAYSAEQPQAYRTSAKAAMHAEGKAYDLAALLDDADADTPTPKGAAEPNSQSERIQGTQDAITNIGNIEPNFTREPSIMATRPEGEPHEFRPADQIEMEAEMRGGVRQGEPGYGESEPRKHNYEINTINVLGKEKLGVFDINAPHKPLLVTDNPDEAEQLIKTLTERANVTPTAQPVPGNELRDLLTQARSRQAPSDVIDVGETSTAIGPRRQYAPPDLELPPGREDTGLPPAGRTFHGGGVGGALSTEIDQPATRIFEGGRGDMREPIRNWSGGLARLLEGPQGLEDVTPSLNSRDVIEGTSPYNQVFQAREGGGEWARPVETPIPPEPTVSPLTVQRNAAGKLASPGDVAAGHYKPLQQLLKSGQLPDSELIPGAPKAGVRLAGKAMKRIGDAETGQSGPTSFVDQLKGSVPKSASTEWEAVGPEMSHEAAEAGETWNPGRSFTPTEQTKEYDAIREFERSQPDRRQARFDKAGAKAGMNPGDVQFQQLQEKMAGNAPEQFGGTEPQSTADDIGFVSGTLKAMGVPTQVAEEATAEHLPFSEKMKNVVNAIWNTMPNIYRSNLLMSSGLPRNVFTDTYGSAFAGASEYALAGDERGKIALKALSNPMNFLRKYKEMLKGEAARHIEEGALGRSEFQGGISTPMQKFMSLPAVHMAAGDLAGTHILMEAGFTEEEARRIMLTSEPGVQGGAVAKTAQQLQNVGRGSALGGMLFPFKRTLLNLAEQGGQRLPILGPMIQAGFDDPNTYSAGHQLAQQGLSVGAGGLGYLLGATGVVDPKGPTGKYLTGAAGMYGMPMAMGLGMGAANQQGGAANEQLAAGLQQGYKQIPLPSTRGAEDLVQLLKTGKIPAGVYPTLIKELGQATGMIEDTSKAATVKPISTRLRWK